MGPERPREPQGGRGERQSRAEGGGEGAEHGRERHKIKKLNVFEGYLSAGFCGRGFGVSSALTTRAGVPDSRIQLYCNRLIARRLPRCLREPMFDRTGTALSVQGFTAYSAAAPRRALTTALTTVVLGAAHQRHMRVAACLLAHEGTTRAQAARLTRPCGQHRHRSHW